MAIYLDPPLWPAHGTHFSHLISDTSLEELHAFAAAAGIPDRAFDGDHYDVAEARYSALVAAGAVPVEGRVLVRQLIASGLRIPARRRSSSLKLPLLTRWNAVLPGHDALFLDLLDRWGEEHRKYHGRIHLLAVLEALDLLTEPVDPPRTVLLAAWFHDAVYRGIAGQDEEESARLAEDRLAQAGLPAAEVDEVARLVRMTADHQPEPGDGAAALLSDADLSVLPVPGRRPAGLRAHRRRRLQHRTRRRRPPAPAAGSALPHPAGPGPVAGRGAAEPAGRARISRTRDASSTGPQTHSNAGSHSAHKTPRDGR